ncbi:MAG: hypothetical protein KF749_13295 [Bacteroidetes bacterium]|nr:hypothetical protein [Bacteroidota bacterium]MCW5894331.1 hypothetical protein [Bacteroidota bacterium]
MKQAKATYKSLKKASRRGRPRSKVSRRQFLEGTWVEWFGHAVDDMATHVILRDLQAKREYPKNYQLTFFGLENRKMNSMIEKGWDALTEQEKKWWDESVEKAGDEWAKHQEEFIDVVKYFRYETRRFKNEVRSPSFKDVARWFFIAGIYYGLEQYAKKRALPLLFKVPFFDITNASSIVKYELQSMENSKLSGLRGTRKVKLPSDLARKYRAPKYPRREVLRFTRTLKEMKGEPTVARVAKLLNWNLAVVVDVAKEAKRQGFHIELGKGRNGEPILVV